MATTYDTALAYSTQWLEIIKQRGLPPQQQAQWIIEESKYNFAEHFNRNWLDYRKSVTEAGIGLPWSGLETVRCSGMCWVASTSTAWAATE